MMDSGFGSMGWFGPFSLSGWIVWFVVGILLIAFLWKKINEK
jgi:hypothetical protein